MASIMMNAAAIMVNTSITPAVTDRVSGNVLVINMKNASVW